MTKSILEAFDELDTSAAIQWEVIQDENLPPGTMQIIPSSGINNKLVQPQCLQPIQTPRPQFTKPTISELNDASEQYRFVGTNKEVIVTSNETVQTETNE